MKILITGGAGFIGSYLIKALQDLGYELFVVDYLPNNGVVPPNNYHQINIIDTEALSKAMQGIDIVFHLAAKHRFFGVTEKEFFETNVNGTQSVLEAMRINNVNRLIFFSSVAVYGELSNPSHEALDPEPNTPYGQSKLKAEWLINRWTLSDNRRHAVVVRPTVVFGPHNKGNIYRLIRQIYYHLYYPIGKGHNVKSIAAVENIVEAAIFLMNLDQEGFQIYNYADPPHLEFRQIVNIIYDTMGRDTPRYSLPYPLMLKIGTIADRFLSATNIAFTVEAAVQKMNKNTYHNHEKLFGIGFEPRLSSSEALSKMVQWYLSMMTTKRDAGNVKST